MATFISGLAKRKSQQAAADQFSRLSADIQAQKLARIALENQGDVDVQSLENVGALDVQRTSDKGALERTNVTEAGETLRRNIAEAGETGRVNIRQRESGRQFDLGYGLDKATEERNKRAFEYDQAELEALEPFRRESRRSQYERRTATDVTEGRRSQREYDIMDEEDALARRGELEQTEARIARDRQERLAADALEEQAALERLRKKKVRQSQDYLGTVFGGY